MTPADPIPTSEEVDRRLRIVSELRNLCISLGRARPWVEPIEGEKVSPTTGVQELPTSPASTDGKSVEVAP